LTPFTEDLPHLIVLAMGTPGAVMGFGMDLQERIEVIFLHIEKCLDAAEHLFS
jgi:hypothetical protein